MDETEHVAAIKEISRLELAANHLKNCTLCPHLCGEARATAQGVCRVGTDSYIASEMMHMGEESILQPAQAIFFSGCTATCTFCTAAKFAFRPTYGALISPEQLAQRMRQRQDEGARSICFIGGDPAPHIPFIIAALSHLGRARRIPTVFNSNLYLTDDALDLLDGYIDIYLPDFKFGPADGKSSCGERIGGMPNYWAVVTRCMERLHDEKKRLLVRHLVMPGHFACCTKPVLEQLAQYPGIEVSLLTQYLAPAHAKGELAEVLTRDEINESIELAKTLGLQLVH